MISIIFSIVILHLVVGFGYLIYKLMPKKKNVFKSKNEDEQQLFI
jgi:hypothetical protein